MTIHDLAYIMQQAKKNKLPKPIFFLGAGASKTGNIPLSDEMVKDILGIHSENPLIQKLEEKDRTYLNLMECLQPSERNQLLRDYISSAKINVTHIYLAQLLNENYVDFIVTVNFDNLMLRALSLYNEYPPIYDLAIFNDITTTTIHEKSVVYLHGQHHSSWLLNTKEEMSKVSSIVMRIFDSIKNKRPWVFIGYSGRDPIFNLIKKLGRFDNGLFWVGYKDSLPNTDVRKFLNQPNTNAFHIKGFKADSFMFKLNNALELEHPRILDKPFTLLKSMLNNIVDIDDEKYFYGVKERLKMSKSDVDQAIRIFELDEHIEINIDERKVTKYKKEIYNIIASDVYNETSIETLSSKIIKAKTRIKSAISLGPLHVLLYYNWGTKFIESAESKNNCEAEIYYRKAIEIFKKADNLNLNSEIIFRNWAFALIELADLLNNNETNELYRKALDILDRSLKIFPYDHYNLFLWGRYLSIYADKVSNVDKEKYYNNAIEKFRNSEKLNPHNTELYFEFGLTLSKLALIKDCETARGLYLQSFEKFKKYTELNPNDQLAFYDWGFYLGHFAKISENQIELYYEAIEKLNSAIILDSNIINANNLIGLYLKEIALLRADETSKKLYLESFSNFQNEIEINPKPFGALNNWGLALTHYAELYTNNEAIKYYIDATYKFQKALAIDPDFIDAYYNWGVTLIQMARNETNQVKIMDFYKQSIKKFKKYLEIKPKDKQTLNSLFIIFIDLVKKQIHFEKDSYFLNTYEETTKSLEICNLYYNLACFYAIRKDKKKAMNYLYLSFKNKEISTLEVKNDEDWKYYKTDKEYLELLVKYEAKL